MESSKSENNHIPQWNLSSFQDTVLKRQIWLGGELKEQLFDPVRQQWLIAQPEELIRQALLHYMTSVLGYPINLISLEKELALLPHVQLNAKRIPQRRIDILCFGQNIHSFHEVYPLLMVECKAVRLTDKVLQQVIGYNDYVCAYFIAVANSTSIQTGWYDKQKEDYCFVEGLPSFQDLMNALRQR